MPRKSKASDTSVKDLIQDFKDLKGELKELVGSEIKSAVKTIKEEIGLTPKSPKNVSKRFDKPKTEAEVFSLLGDDSDSSEPADTKKAARADSDSNDDEFYDPQSAFGDFLDFEERSKFDPKTNDKKNRRESFLDKITDAAEQPKNFVTYTKAQPSYEHISLTDLKLRSILKFIDDVNEYRLSHQLPLPVASRVSSKVREHLCAKNAGIGLTMEKFLRCKSAHVLRFILKECRPDSTLEFQQNLRKYTYFDLPHGYIPSCTDFRIFNDALLLYRHKFLRA